MILRTRILALAALLTVLFLSLITYTLVFFTSASAQLNRLVGRSLAVEKIAEGLNATVLGIRSDIWDTMIFDVEHRSDHIARLDDQAKTFFQGLRDLSAADPQFVPAAKELHILFQGYYQFGSTLLELESLDQFVGQVVLVQKFRQNQADLLGKLAQTLADSKQQFFGSMEQLNDDFRDTTTTAYTLAGLVTLLSFIIAFLMARRLAQPLEQLTRTVRQVSGGDYSVRPVPTSSGEIRSLTETFVTMLDRIEDYSTRMEDLVRARTDALVRTNAVMVRELKLAQKIQDALIPHTFPRTGPLTAAGAYLPMEDLGGDFYDVFEGSPGQWTLVMADVSGHGVPASLITAMVKVSLGLHGPQTIDPGRTLEEVNRELVAALGDLRRYVTMVLCHLDLNRGVLSYCNAGHNELVIVRRSGEVETRGPNSGVVGLRTDEVFFTRSLPFSRGDGVFLFTDGLIEARDRHQREFGLERLLHLVHDQRSQGPARLVDRVTAEVTAFSGDLPRQDDIAYLAVRWEEDGPGTQDSGPEGDLVTGEETSPTLAEDLYRNRELDTLETWINARLAASPSPRETGRLLHWQAMALYHRGRNTEALAAWDQALAADPENQRARRNRGYLARHLGVPG